MKTSLLQVIVLSLLFFTFPCYADQYSSSPFNSVNDIAVEGDMLWCAANGGVIQWNKKTGGYITYTTSDDGVYGDYQRFVEVDHNGVKWFGSNNGIITFDGESWNKVTDTIASDILVDSKNVVWIISGSLRKIDADTGNEIFYEKSGENFNHLRYCAEGKDGVMWFGSGNGVYRFDGISWINYTFDNYWANDVKDIAVDNDGVVWVVTNGGGILSYDMIEWTNHNEANPLLSYNCISVCVDVNNVKWFAEYFGGLISYNNSIWEYHNMDDYKFRNLIRDGDIIWGTTYSQGIIGFNDSLWINLYIPFEKIQNIFTSAAVDSNNTKWFGSDGFGIYSLNKDGIVSYSTENGLPGNYENTIVSIGVDEDGSVLAKSEDGRCVRFNGEAWELLGSYPSFEFPNYKEVVIGEEKWTAKYGEHGNLARTSNDEVTTFYDYRRIYSVAADLNGHIWAGGRTTIANETVFCYDGENWTTYPIEAGKGVTAIVVDHNNIAWFCTEGAGIWCYDGVKWNQYTMNGDGLYTWDDTNSQESTDGYLPMSVGNYWLYNHRYSWSWDKYDFPDNLIVTIVGKSELDGQIYFKFLDGRLMRMGDDGNIYRDGVLFYDFTPSEGPFNYEVPGNYVTREHSSIDVPIGTCKGYDFSIYFWEHGYRDFLTQNLGLVYYQYSSDTGQGDIYELYEAYINGVKYTDWTSNVKINRPVEYISLGNYPNPFNPSTTIKYTLPQDSQVTLSIYNISGQRVSVLIDKIQPAGNYTATWDASVMPSGLYFCNLKADGFTETRKMLLVK